MFSAPIFTILNKRFATNILLKMALNNNQSIKNPYLPVHWKVTFKYLYVPWQGSPYKSLFALTWHDFLFSQRCRIMDRALSKFFTFKNQMPNCAAMSTSWAFDSWMCKIKLRKMKQYYIVFLYLDKISIQYYLTINDKRSRYGYDPSIWLKFRYTLNVLITQKDK